MELKIGNKNYPLYFGWEFLEQVNNLFGFVVDVNGIEINTRMNGFPFMEQGLESYDLIAVQKVIQSATATEKTTPSKANIRKLIEEKLYEGAEAYQEFVEALHSEIKKDKMLKALSELNV